MQSKQWIGTSYRLTEFSLPPQTIISYGVYQEEMCPTTHRRHIQFLVVFLKRLRFTGVRKLFPGDHLEVCRDLQAGIAYCSKEDTRVSPPVEVGTRPLDATTATMLERVKKARVIDVIVSEPKLWRNLRTLEALRSAVAPARTQLTRIVLLSGGTGTGKTKVAARIAEFVGDAYWHPGEQWWPSYDQQELVVFDEYRGQWPSAVLLRLGDRTPFKVPYKGGYAEFNSSLIVLTSNLSLLDMYPNLDIATLEALRRRVSVIKF